MKRQNTYTPLESAQHRKNVADLVWKIVLALAVLGVIAWLAVVTVHYDEEGDRGPAGTDGNSYLEDRIVVNETTDVISVKVDASTPAEFFATAVHLDTNVRVRGNDDDSTKGHLDVRVGDAQSDEKIVVQGYGSDSMAAPLLGKLPAMTLFNGETNIANNPAMYAAMTTSVGEVGAIAGHFEFGVTRSNSTQMNQGVHTALENEDPLGTIAWRGDDGTDVRTAGAYISAAMVGHATSNDVPATVTHYASSQIKFVTGLENDIGFSFDPHSASPSHDARIGFNGNRAKIGYFSAGPISAQNAFGIHTSKHIELQVDNEGDHVKIEHGVSGRQIDVQNDHVAVWSNYTIFGQTPGDTPNHHLVINQNIENDTRVMVRSQSANSMLEILSHYDGNPGKSSCVTLGNKYDNVAGNNIPDNSWMICIHAGTGTSDFNPSLTFSWDIASGNGTDWPSPSDNTTYNTMFEMKTNGDIAVERHVIFEEDVEDAGLRFNNPSGATTGTTLREYAEHTESIVLTGAWAANATRSFHFIRVGRLVTVTWEFHQATADSAEDIFSDDGAFPRWAYPIYDLHRQTSVVDNSTTQTGSLSITLGGKISFYSTGDHGSFTASNNAGFYGGSISYMARYTTEA
jgi:hypothetical protein